MPFIPLNNVAGDVPGLNDWRFRHILIMQEKPFNSTEHIDYLCLFSHVWQLIGLSHISMVVIISGLCFLRWPIFKLKHFSICKQTYYASPIFWCEPIDWVINFKSNLNAFRTSYFLFEFFLGCILIIASLDDGLGRFVSSFFEELYRIFKAYITWIIWSRYNDDRFCIRRSLVELIVIFLKNIN